MAGLIATCDAAAVLKYPSNADLFAGQDTLRHIDSTVALSSIVKGMCGERSISRIVEAIGIMAYQIGYNI